MQVLKNRCDIITFSMKSEVHNSEPFAAHECQREVHQIEESSVVKSRSYKCMNQHFKSFEVKVFSHKAQSM